MCALLAHAVLECAQPLLLTATAYLYLLPTGYEQSCMLSTGHLQAWAMLLCGCCVREPLETATGLTRRSHHSA